jgi:tight adherence protein B
MIGPAEQLAGAIAGFAVLLATIGLAIRAERTRLNARLETFLGRLGGPRPISIVDGDRPQAATRRATARRIRLGAQPRQLAQAGLSITPNRFLVVQLAAGAVGLAVGRVLAGRLAFEGISLIAVVTLGTVLGLWVPMIFLGLRRSRRIRRAEQQFPLAVDAIANAIQVGQSLPQAIELIGRDMPAPVGPEFTQVIREMGLGVPFERALDGLAERLGLRDVEIFVAAVHIQYRTGGNLSETLRGIANTIRERLRIRGEIRVLTGQQRISAYIVSALPLFIAMTLKFFSPSYFDRLLEPGSMRILVVGALVLLVAGFYVLRRIADIEV